MRRCRGAVYDWAAWAGDPTFSTLNAVASCRPDNVTREEEEEEVEEDRGEAESHRVVRARVVLWGLSPDHGYPLSCCLSSVACFCA